MDQVQIVLAEEPLTKAGREVPLPLPRGSFKKANSLENIRKKADEALQTATDTDNALTKRISELTEQNSILTTEKTRVLEILEDTRNLHKETITNLKVQLDDVNALAAAAKAKSLTDFENQAKILEDLRSQAMASQAAEKVLTKNIAELKIEIVEATAAKQHALDGFNTLQKNHEQSQVNTIIIYISLRAEGSHLSKTYFQRMFT